MTVKISGTDGIDVAQLRAADGDPVALTISSAGVVEFPQSAFANKGPTFRAYRTADQTGILANTWTKILFTSVEFDTASAFDVVNSRFQPNIAGYYYVSGQCLVATAKLHTGLYKNGALHSHGGGSVGMVSSFNGLVYLNGSTDYLELYGNMNSGGNFICSYTTCSFSAVFVREP